METINNDIFSFKVGRFEIFTLIESERDGNAGILIGADEAVLSRYIPAEGFKQSVCAFLVKAHGQNILVDAGTGADDILIDMLKKLGVEPDKINAVLITHLHGDHFGSLQKNGAAVFPNAKVYIDVKEYEYHTQAKVNQGAVTALAPYVSAGNIEYFEASALGSTFKEILPGVYPIAAYGHTPGHTVYLIQNESESLFIAGDLLHIALVQFPVPEISATYDVDLKAAAVMRRQIMDYAAKNKILFGGMHIVYPGIGLVETNGEGFKYTQVR